MTTFWPATINGAILSTLLSFIIWLWLRVTPRRVLNAATRYAIWCMVLAVTLALPLSYVKWQGTDYAQAIAFRVVRPETGTEAPQTRIAGGEKAASPQKTTVARNFRLPVEIPASRWMRPVLIVWIAGALLLVLRVMVSYAALHRRIARAPDAPLELRERLDRWLKQSGANRRGVRLALSGEIGIPMAAGLLYPTILIPSELFNRLTYGDLEHIGLHEATHLARRDDCMLFVQRIVEALFALHPVVRWVGRQIDLEREIACDDTVAGMAESAQSYADCLTRIVVACRGVRPSLGAANVADSRSHLSRRVELLVDRDRGGPARLLRRRFAALATMLICVAGLLAKTPLLVGFAVPGVTNSAPSPAPAVRQPLLMAQNGPQPASPPAPRRPDVSAYVLGPNDLLEVNVAGDGKLTGKYAIASDGHMSIPLIGGFSAAGLTIPELQALIRQKLSAYLTDPIVEVRLLRNNGKGFRISGGVLRPGIYPLVNETTILDAIAESGGLDNLAIGDKIVLLRGKRAATSPVPADRLASPISGNMKLFSFIGTFAETFPFNYDEAIKGIHMEQNVTIKNGDVLFVPLG